MNNTDWRPYLSEVKDQGDCGSCLAFGSIMPWEGMIRNKAGDKNLLIDLSERDLFTCSGGKCDQGNTVEATLNQGLRGIAAEADCPYDARDHSCGEGRSFDWWKNGKKMETWSEVSSIDEIKKMLIDGPLMATMAVHQSFLNYVSGIYHNLGAFDPIVGYHCICLAGGTDDYCIIRNSWTKDWGENGDSRMKWSELDDVAFFIRPSDEPIPEPEPEPTPSPCWIGNHMAAMMNLMIVAAGVIGKNLHIQWLIRKGRFYYLNPGRG